MSFFHDEVVQFVKFFDSALLSAQGYMKVIRNKLESFFSNVDGEFRIYLCCLLWWIAVQKEHFWR